MLIGCTPAIFMYTTVHQLEPAYIRLPCDVLSSSSAAPRERQDPLSNDSLEHPAQATPQALLSLLACRLMWPLSGAAASARQRDLLCKVSLG